ncbi:hypothetical protein [Bradyrhizobium sp. 1(2017)]|uniref:hypothetical protein n=1 Tax=Bradyrhizobium sp. 1(2017) TaxID=1404888 RepID=UPI00140F3200|nr:hypothetical protein [Bradyrhizobium sp. 1(2017)]QIO36946.1 hypothetical protein HAP40_36665 [Bradyrhizobium sp. 1(2017)]
MTDRPASWRFPTRQQMEKLVSSPAMVRETSPTRAVGPADDLPPEYWQAVLEDPRIAASPTRCASGRTLRLSRIPEHILRVGCRRCGRTVEIQKVDAVRLYGPDAVWRDVGQRLLDNTCSQRTGRHEEDGCWPSFEGA